MTKEDRLNLARKVVTNSLKAGADDVSVSLSKYRSVDIEYRDGKLDQLKESTQNSLSLSIYADNRYTSHSTNDLRPDALAKFSSEAVAMTKYLSEDKYRKLPDPKWYEGKKNIDLKLYDNQVDSITSEQRIGLAEELESLARQESDKIITCTSGFYDSTSESVKINSNGFEGSKKSANFSYGIQCTIDDSADGKIVDWNYINVRDFNDIPKADQLARDCIARCLGKVGQSKMESGVYKMLVENRAASRILYGMIGSLSGRALQQKNTFYEGKLEQRIASDKLTITDDPFIKKGLGSRLYDGEGIAARKRAIVDQGILKSFNIDSYYGRKLGMDPTSGSTSNLVFSTGDKNLEQLIAMIDKGILVTSFIGGNSNSTTGDFSYGIVGKYIENGKVVKPVNEMNISGNYIELWSNLIETGNDPYIYSSYRRPSLLFDNVQFSGL